MRHAITAVPTLAALALAALAPAALAQGPQPLTPADGATVEADPAGGPVRAVTFSCPGSAPYVRYSRSPQTGPDGFLLAEGIAEDDSSPLRLGDGRCASSPPRALADPPPGAVGRASGGLLYWQVRTDQGVSEVRRIFVTLATGAFALFAPPTTDRRDRGPEVFYRYGFEPDRSFALELSSLSCAAYAARCASRRWVIKRFDMEVDASGKLRNPSAAGPSETDDGGGGRSTRPCNTNPEAVGGEVVLDRTIPAGSGDDQVAGSASLSDGRAAMYCAWSVDIAPQGGESVRLSSWRVVTARAPLSLRLRATRRSGGHLLSAAGTCRLQGSSTRCLGPGTARKRAVGRYTVQRRTGGRWRSVATMRLDASGTYRLRVSCRKGSSRSVCAGDRLRVRFAETDDAPASSPWQHLDTTSKSMRVQ